MKNRIRFIFWIFAVYLYLPTYGQSFFKKKFFQNGVEVKSGVSTQKQDRRLFAFPAAQGYIEHETSTNDFEYLVLINKRFFPKYRVNFSAGLGYSIFQDKFSRPFDHSYLDRKFTEDLRTVRCYLKHSSVFEFSPSIFLIKKAMFQFFVEAPLFAKFTLNKRVWSVRNKPDGSKWKYNRWLFDFGSVEANLGAGFRIKKVGVHFSYRYYNLQKIDRMIFWSDFYHEPLKGKTFEELNIEKYWLTVSYKIN